MKWGVNGSIYRRGSQAAEPGRTSLIQTAFKDTHTCMDGWTHMYERHTHTHAYICIYTHVCTKFHAYINTHFHTQKYIHNITHTFMHKDRHAKKTHIYMHTHTHEKHTCI